MIFARVGVLIATGSVLLGQSFALPAGAEGPLVCGVDLSTSFTVDSEYEPVVAMSESGKLIYATSVVTPDPLGGPSTVLTTVATQGEASFTIPGVVRLSPGPDGIIWMKHSASEGAISEQGILHYSPSAGVRKPDSSFSTAFYDVMPDGRALVVTSPSVGVSSPSSLLSSDGSLFGLVAPPVTGIPQHHGVFYSAEAALINEHYLVQHPATPTQPAIIQSPLSACSVFAERPSADEEGMVSRSMPVYSQFSMWLGSPRS